MMNTGDQPGVLAADDSYENDSSLGEEDIRTTTTSLSSSILKFREENGRTYHSYKEGKYLFPNDEPENDRLDLQHHLFDLTFDGRLFTAPIPEGKSLHHVLDVGTGTGIWAIDFADKHPESLVYGIDLSPIQPAMVPPNVVFQVDDLEEPWTFTNKFDFIYSRMMSGAFANWPLFFKQSFEYVRPLPPETLLPCLFSLSCLWQNCVQNRFLSSRRNLAPGGYIEVVDYNYPFRVDDNSLPTNSALQKWTQLMLEGCAKAGRPIDVAQTFKKQLEDMGFTDVVETQYKWPGNRWPKDPKYKELGMTSSSSFLFLTSAPFFWEVGKGYFVFCE